MTRDEKDAIILAAVRQAVEDDLDPAEELSVWGYGPVDLSKTNPECYVLVDLLNAPPLPNKVDVTIDGSTVKVKINRLKKKKFKIHGAQTRLTRRSVLASSIAVGCAGLLNITVGVGDGYAADLLPDILYTVDIPSAPAGPQMGGDAIFNTTYRDGNPAGVYWGTIAFVTGGNAQVKERGGNAQQVANSCLSSAHVLHHKDGGTIETYHYTSGLETPTTLGSWPIDSPNPATSPLKWADLAASSVQSGVSVRPNEVRGLGVIEGVAAAEPGDVVGKYGASTGLTVARDIGLVWRRLPTELGERFYLIRAVSGQFAGAGDFGAAVIHIGLTGGVIGPKYRKLAGFVLGGTSEDDEQWYLPAVLMGEPSTVLELEAIEVGL